MVRTQGEVSYHQKHVEGDLFFDFGRIPRWNCPVAGKQQQPVSLLPERPRSSAAGAAAALPKAPLKSAAPSSGPPPVAASKTPWFIPPIQCNEPEDGVFFAQVNWPCVCVMCIGDKSYWYLLYKKGSG